MAAVAAVHLTLSERAGEARAPCAYAHHVLLHLLDVVLSCHGDVFSNRKWYLLRWRRFREAGEVAPGGPTRWPRSRRSGP